MLAATSVDRLRRADRTPRACALSRHRFVRS